jgi:hypothetical protein
MIVLGRSLRARTNQYKLIPSQKGKIYNQHEALGFLSVSILVICRHK